MFAPAMNLPVLDDFATVRAIIEMHKTRLSKLQPILYFRINYTDEEPSGKKTSFFVKKYQH